MDAAYSLTDNTLHCHGAWTRDAGNSLAKQLERLKSNAPEHLLIDGSDVTIMDTVGAWLLQKTIAMLEAQGSTVEMSGFSFEAEHLLTIVTEQPGAETPIPPTPHLSGFAFVGKLTIGALHQAQNMLRFFGEVFIYFLVWLKDPRRTRWRALFALIQTTGYQAIPIVALLSFLIGIVLAYQMGTELKNYGADIFLVDLLGLAMLREFGPLLTAVIVAGRTGSAYTAQLGTMKLNQEVDALQTMGLSSREILVLPKVFALLIALPLLTVIANIAGIAGGMLMSKILFGIGFEDFLSHFQKSIKLSTYLVGMVKTPVFAMIIASIGCFQGFQVKNDAESVGRHTTTSVVQSIFLIIVADAAFSILFSVMGV